MKENPQKVHYNIWYGKERVLLESPSEYYQNYKYKKTLLDLVLRAVKGLSAEPIRMLDLGSGTGEKAFLVYEYVVKNSNNGLDFIGLDISETGTRKAAQRASLLNSPIRFLVGSVDAMPFPENFFDIVIMTELLEHVYEPRTSLIEVRRVLKQNGMLILGTPNKDYFFEKLSLKIPRIHKLLAGRKLPGEIGTRYWGGAAPFGVSVQRSKEGS